MDMDSLKEFCLQSGMTFQDVQREMVSFYRMVGFFTIAGTVAWFETVYRIFMFIQKKRDQVDEERVGALFFAGVLVSLFVMLLMFFALDALLALVMPAKYMIYTLIHG